MQVKKIIYAFQSFLLVLFIPFILGQEKCPISNEMLSSINNLIQKKFQPAGPGENIYIAQLSFIDAITRTMVAQTDEVRLINDAVLNGIRQAQKVNSFLKYNDPNHTIKNTDANVNKLIDIFYNADYEHDERMDNISRHFMHKVDLIVTGEYVDKGQVIILKPLIISKRDRKHIARQLSFKKSEYICPDPLRSSRKVLCPNASEEIAKAVKELLESL